MSASIVEPLFNLEQMAARNGSNSFENGLTGQDILSVAQFEPEELDYIFGRAQEMREMVKQVGGTEGLCVTFLEETFSASTAPPTWST